MKEFGKNLVEHFIGRKFRTVTDCVVENYETTNDTVLIESVFDELFEAVEFETYIDFLNEDVALPVVQPSAPETKRYSFATMKADMAGAHTKWRDKKALKAARADLGIKPGTKLFTAQGGNPKLAKEESTIPDRGTIGLTLLPEKQSGLINTCPCATGECAKACLNMTGRGAMSQEARRRKLERVVTKAHSAAIVLHHEIDAHERAMAKQGKKAVDRMNVVQDIPWEIIHPEIFSEHKNTQFYDYTKIASRVLNADGSKKQLPENYHLTFSSTGLQGPDSNWHHARQHLNNGGVVAMVFAVHAGRGKKPGGALPSHVIDQATGKKYRVVDGDAHDHRYLDHQLNGIDPSEGVIAGLRIKGGKKNLAKAGDFAVRPTDDQGSPVMVSADHPANKQK
jgi:hypothetical protein